MKKIACAIASMIIASTSYAVTYDCVSQNGKQYSVSFNQVASSINGVPGTRIGSEEGFLAITAPLKKSPVIVRINLEDPDASEIVCTKSEESKAYALSCEKM